MKALEKPNIGLAHVNMSALAAAGLAGHTESGKPLKGQYTKASEASYNVQKNILGPQRVHQI